MRKPLKRITATLMALVLFGSSLALSASAAIPHAYWQYQVPFQTAKTEWNVDDIITYGLAIEEIMLAEEWDSDVACILETVYIPFYQLYEEMGDYDTSIYYLEKYLEVVYYLNDVIGLDRLDAIQIAERRIEVIDPMTEVYAVTGNSDQAIYFGAVNEPEMGTYYGRVYTGEGDDPTEAESAVSIYVDFLDENIADFDYFISPLDDGDHIIHVGWNMPNENADLPKVLTADTYITETLTYLASLDSPVFLRIGGEMNVWTDLADPDAYKAAFIKIANIAHEIAPNVALVFSPNSLSEWTTDIDDYYPGDEYVDWVGISNYSNLYRYYYNPVVTGSFEEMYYNAGDYANPITVIKDIIDLYGDRKPIMITEGGSGHTIVSSGIDLTDFASLHMTQYYSYLNMVYPQIKAIIYFDHDYSGSPYRYALNSNSTVKSAYLTATTNNSVLLHSTESGSVTYVTADQYADDMETITLSAYCNPPADPTVTVSYILDGTSMASVSAIPYTYNLDVTSLSQGSHSLTVTFSASDGYTATKEYTLIKGEGNNVVINSADGYSFTQEEAAQALYDAGVWSGMGTNADGSIDFGLDQTCTREQIVKLLITLLGEESQVTSAYASQHSFTDVSDWASMYIGYAYVNGLASGTSDTTFGGGATNSTVAQCLTFILRGLGYSSDTDFAWDSPWTLSDAIGLTYGQYTSGTASITRGEIGQILYAATLLG